MAVKTTRRDLLNFGAGTAATLGVSTLAGELMPVRAHAQAGPASNVSKEELFYREDWFGEPWRKPEVAVLIHGNDESSVVWYGWVPRMAQEFRLLRPDLPGFGQSGIPAGFEWSLPSLAAFVARVLDKAGVEAAHIIGAKTGGAIAMQFAADYPTRTRTLAVASGPASVIVASSRSNIPQRDRLGSAVSKEMVEYWNHMFATAPEEGAKGLRTALSKFDLARDGVLQRIKAPTLVITSDRSALQSVEKVRQYQLAIPNSRLAILNGDAYHIAAANADECVTNVLAFIKEARHRT
ncbi:MAG TPA: alpha/beta fold hydrolase [Xanthobacteraceae bacterium]|nr:alpha/beta fold hydrolase [Xanthobacteraceae bacterium]